MLAGTGGDQPIIVLTLLGQRMNFIPKSWWARRRREAPGAGSAETSISGGVGPVDPLGLEMHCTTWVCPQEVQSPKWFNPVGGEDHRRRSLSF